MTLRSRLAAGWVTIVVILLVPLVLAVQSLARLHENALVLQNRDFGAALILGRLREGITDLRAQENALLIVHNAEARDSMAARVDELGRLADSLTHFQLDSASRTIAGAVDEVARWAPAEFRAALAGISAEALTISEQHVLPALARGDSAARVGEAELRARTSEGVAATLLGIEQTQAAAVVGMLMALAIAAAIAIFLTRSIIRPVASLERGMRAVADGDLGFQVPIESDRQDELSQLAHSFQEMTGQLKELDKLKAEFISVASHELKTPINVMVGYLQLIEEGVYGPMTPEQSKILKTVETQAQTLLRLSKQLLDVSRFEAGGGRLDIRKVDLAHFLGELERAFHVLAVQREVRFSVHAGEGLPTEVFWDLDRMNEVLGNLLANAFKFTPHGGTVELRVEHFDASVEMQVKDSGAGIPPEQLPRIFDKFYQADNQKSARAVGTGLGLAIAKQIVDAHGGRIECESTVGVGTTFTIVLPAHVARRSSVRQARARQTTAPV